jgi:hypothetical protein
VGIHGQEKPRVLTEHEGLALAAKVATFGSAEVLDRLEAVDKATLAVQSLALSMAETERQGGTVVGQPYLDIEAARTVMRSRVRELEASVRSDLESL